MFFPSIAPFIGRQILVEWLTPVQFVSANVWLSYYLFQLARCWVIPGKAMRKFDPSLGWVSSASNYNVTGIEMEVPATWPLVIG
jgi:hypothetical protein